MGLNLSLVELKPGDEHEHSRRDLFDPHRYEGDIEFWNFYLDRINHTGTGERGDFSIRPNKSRDFDILERWVIDNFPNESNRDRYLALSCLMRHNENLYLNGVW